MKHDLVEGAGFDEIVEGPPESLGLVVFGLNEACHEEVVEGAE
ncbi:hypothetical protein HNR46_003510 [Haloferula luteola]|uniref:Uncharacterized protein n=1 Tax=Haloferula luteola TaxID=595692 RepID=A0A840V5F9_9BACT|nr:hypothetical protein [Haloferula luteola]MBB5353255.1 hypothetical protein [Haloferula luteola]